MLALDEGHDCIVPLSRKLQMYKPGIMASSSIYKFFHKTDRAPTTWGSTDLSDESDQSRNPAAPVWPWRSQRFSGVLPSASDSSC